MLVSNLMSLAEAARRRFGNCVSYHSLRRWAVEGVGRPPVKLKVTRIGKRYFTDDESIDAFLKAVDDPALYTRKARDERVDKAVRKLKRRGA